MMKTTPVGRIAFSLFIYFITASLASAQEGHPMSGSWVGDWGFDGEERHRVVIIMDWTGTELAGTINPGPHAIPIAAAMVNPDDWSLHLEAEGMDAEGSQVRYVIDGTIDDLGTYNRNITGVWRVNDRQGNFSITRQ